MVVYEELKQIAQINEKRNELLNMLFEKTELDGLQPETAEFIKDCRIENGHLYDSDGNRLDNCGLVNDEYYCNQSKGYLDDVYYGTLYYATDEKGTFVKISFNTY